MSRTSREARKRRPLSASPAVRPPRPPVDPLSEVLDCVRLQCMGPSAHEMTAPWGVRFGVFEAVEFQKRAASLGLPPPPRNPPLPHGVIIAVLRGHCWLEVEADRLKLPLGGGDVVMLNRHAAFTLRDDPRTPVKPVLDLVRREDLEHFRGMTHGGGGAATTFLCAGYRLEDEADNPLLRALPPVIHLRSSQTETVPWLEGTLRFLAQELAGRGPGSQSVINHLAHILFVQAVRAHAATLSEELSGNWFAALLDAELAPALGAIHQRPEEHWTVARLAEESNISRSAFAARFTAVMGCPPLQYLTECRMRQARRLLREADQGAKTIAAKVGYANEAAFSHAFRRLTGVSPGRYRQAAAEAKVQEFAADDLSRGPHTRKAKVVRQPP